MATRSDYLFAPDEHTAYRRSGESADMGDVQRQSADLSDFEDAMSSFAHSFSDRGTSQQETAAAAMDDKRDGNEHIQPPAPLQREDDDEDPGTLNPSMSKATDVGDAPKTNASQGHGRTVVGDQRAHRPIITNPYAIKKTSSSKPASPTSPSAPVRVAGDGSTSPRARSQSRHGHNTEPTSPISPKGPDVAASGSRTAMSPSKSTNSLRRESTASSPISAGKSEPRESDEPGTVIAVPAPTKKKKKSTKSSQGHGASSPRSSRSPRSPRAAQSTASPPRSPGSSSAARSVNVAGAPLRVAQPDLRKMSAATEAPTIRPTKPKAAAGAAGAAGTAGTAGAAAAAASKPTGPKSAPGSGVAVASTANKRRAPSESLDQDEVRPSTPATDISQEFEMAPEVPEQPERKGTRGRVATSSMAGIGAGLGAGYAARASDLNHNDPVLINMSHLSADDSITDSIPAQNEEFHDAQSARSVSVAVPPAATAEPAKGGQTGAGAAGDDARPVSNAALPSHAEDPQGEKRPSWITRHRWLPWVLAALALIVVLAVALGVGLGVGLNQKNGDNRNNVSTAGEAGSKSGGGGGGGKGSNGPTPKPLARWDWTSTKNKVFGTNLGGLFLLERWMYEDWMVDVGGPDAWDEFSMAEKMGDKMQDPLKKHIESWFTEDDMNTLQSAGVNMIRIPIGYWPFFSAKTVGEPYQNATHLDKLSQIMHWSWERGIYVLIDMHGMPGSQNNDQSSGHNFSSHDPIIDWYTPANQNYSRQTVLNMLSWIDQHPAKSVVAGVTTVNEPKINGNDTYDRALREYYDFSLSALKPHKIPLIAHHAFVDEPYKYWESYADKQDPNQFVFDDHPYPAWFQNPQPRDKSVMIDNICKYGNQMSNFPVPVLMGEFSAISILNETAWTSDYLATQLKVFGWSAGSTFFNFKVQETNHPILASPPEIASKYSMLDMLKPNNPTGTFPRRNTSMPVVQWTNQLTSNCGSDPEISW